MPFGEYADFADCVRKNQDKRDPEAYCAAIKQRIEGDAKPKPHRLFRHVGRRKGT